MTYSCHSDDGVTGNSGIHDNTASKLHEFTTFFSELLWNPRRPRGRKLCSPRTLIVMGTQLHAFATLMHLLPRVKWNKDLEWFSHLVQPAEVAQHQLLLLYKWGGWSVGRLGCVFMTPVRISLKKGDKVILPVSSSFALAIPSSHTRGGRNTETDWQWRIGKKGKVKNKWRRSATPEEWDGAHLRVCAQAH